jgi:hypothetical protein
VPDTSYILSPKRCWREMREGDRVPCSVRCLPGQQLPQMGSSRTSWQEEQNWVRAVGSQVQGHFMSSALLCTGQDHRLCPAIWGPLTQGTAVSLSPPLQSILITLLWPGTVQAHSFTLPAKPAEGGIDSHNVVKVRSPICPLDLSTGVPLSLGLFSA